MKKFVLLPLVMIFLLCMTSSAFAIPVKFQMIDWNAWGRLYSDGTVANPNYDPGDPTQGPEYFPAGTLLPPGSTNPYDGSTTQDLFAGVNAGDGTEDAYGIARVQKITDTTTDGTIWERGTKELSIFFYGADDVRLDVIPNTTSILYTSGFRAEIWLSDVGSFDTTLGPAGRNNPADETHYQGVTDVGEMVLSLEAHDLFDNGTAYDVKEFGDPVTGAFFGSAWLNVIGGTWAQYYNTDDYDLSDVSAGTGGLTTADMKISFSTQGEGIFDWVITGTGEAWDTNVIPEPTTMLLFGFGLLGLAGVGRRKAA